MTTRLTWLGGQPEGLRILARALKGSAVRLSDVNGALRDVCAASDWDSDAGRAFAAEAQGPPWVIACLITRYSGASAALHTLAGALEEAQGEVSAAMSSHAEAWRRHNVLLDRLSFATDPVEQQDIERSIHSELVIIDAAEKRHTAACRRAKDADLACARQFRALAEDALDDPTGYTWLVNAGKVSGPVAMVGAKLPGQGKLIGVAGGMVGVASQVSLLVFYDEGSWKDLAVNLGTSVVVMTGGALVAGSAVGGKAVLDKGIRTFTKEANHTTGFRIGAGVRTSFDGWSDGWRKKLGLIVPVRAVVPSRPVAPGGTWLTKATNKAVSRADRSFVDGWRLATVNGPQAQRMFVAGITLKQGPGVVNQAASAKGALDDRAKAGGERSQVSAGLP